MYQPEEYEKCFREMILRFGDKRSSQQDLTKLLIQLPVTCKSTWDEIRLFDVSRYILLQCRRFPKIYEGYLSDRYWNRNIFSRLSETRKEKFMYDFENFVEKQLANGITEAPSYMDYFFLHWSEGLASQLREIHSINKDLYFDPLKSTLKPAKPPQEKKLGATGKGGPDGGGGEKGSQGSHSAGEQSGKTKKNTKGKKK